MNGNIHIMYNIDQLNAMEADRVRSIAAEMGMKKAESADRQEAEYFILDNQAITSAKEIAEKSVAQPKKRGRKPKKQQPAATTVAAAEETATDGQEATAAEQQPKKRGRKPKQKNVEQPTLFDDQTAAEQPEKETNADTPEAKTDEQVKVITTDDLPIISQPKRRGREAKEKTPDEEVKNAEAPEAGNEGLYITEEAVPAQQPQAEVANAETQPQEAPVNEAETPRQAPQQAVTGKKSFRNASVKDTSLDSFFPVASTRKFTPRSQRQAEEQVVTPVMIEEPKAQPQQKTRQQKTGRVQRQQNFARQAESYSFENIVSATGVLEIMPEGFGFLRSSDYNYLASPDDIYVAQNFIKQYALKPGDVVECSVNPPRDGEKYFPLGKVLRVNGQNPVTVRDRIPFEHLTPLFPEEKFDITSGPMGNISTRIVDMFAPIGKGQRALIVAPPKTGKTILLKDIANAIASNHPDTYIIMLLIDERPEEVTDMARSVNAEVIASTFDEPADRHVKIAGIVLEKAKRLVESGHDVVIMLDSITRLARAYNTVAPASGKILSGGVDANALQKPKRFFGAARNIENGGSLTIIATALTETSSKMDEVIFEEFKGTGNMELQLDRKLSNKRLFPAVDIIASSTRREDLLTNPEILNRMWLLRNYISDMNSIEALEFIKKQMETTRNNLEILHNMNG